MLRQKTGTLESLVTLSEELPKHDTFFTATVAKTVDTLRNLLNNDPSKLAQHVLVNEQPVDSYILRGWSWNEGRYGVQRGIREMIDVLNKVRSVQCPLRAVTRLMLALWSPGNVIH